MATRWHPDRGRYKLGPVPLTYFPGDKLSGLLLGNMGQKNSQLLPFAGWWLDVGGRASGPPGGSGDPGLVGGAGRADPPPGLRRDPPRWPSSQAPTVSPNVMERGAGPLRRAALTESWSSQRRREEPTAPSPRGQGRASQRQRALMPSRPPCVRLCQDFFCA